MFPNIRELLPKQSELEPRTQRERSVEMGIRKTDAFSSHTTGSDNKEAEKLSKASGSLES